MTGQVTRLACARYENLMSLSAAPDHEALDCRLPDRQLAAAGRGLPAQRVRSIPADFLAQAAVSLAALRRAEDAFVDELFAAAPDLGIPLLAARFPRSYVDANREPYELDPGMFEGPLPRGAQSPHDPCRGRARHDPAGGGQRRGDLSRPRRRPTRSSGGWRPAGGPIILALSSAGRADLRPVRRRPADRRPFHALLGLGHRPARARASTSCWATITARPARRPDRRRRALAGRQGLRVRRNQPYAGGFTTQRYGRPGLGRHALQIEINRALYMDEARHTKLPTFGATRAADGRPARGDRRPGDDAVAARPLAAE